MSFYPPRSPNKRTSLRRPASTMGLRTNARKNFSAASSPANSRPSSSVGARTSRPGSSLGRNMNAYSGTVRVSVRPRPLGTSSKKTSWRIDASRGAISAAEVGEFVYDHVWTPDTDNSTVYSDSTKFVVENVVRGFNGTVFAYGTTGSGKTHSMQGTPADPGIISRASHELFDLLGQSEGSAATVTVSYLEIYNEKIVDLLSMGNDSSSSDLKLREDPVYGIKVLGLSEIKVADANELLSVVRQGHSSRITRETEYNSRSSRSHAIVIIRIFWSESSKVASLSLCDLAGSEKAALENTRRKEGAFINKSLLTLSTVISKLSSAASSGNAAGHLSFRDSKLTRLLQPSLSGNAVISVLCTVHLGDQSETAGTLRFAAKARNIEISVTQQFSEEKLVEKLQKQIHKQQVEIDLLKASNGLNSLSIGNSNNDEASGDLKHENAKLVAENRLLTERIEHLTRLTNEKRTEHVLLKNDVMNVLTSSTFLDNPATMRSLEEMFKKQQLQIEEYTSYISHLENELGKFEIKKYFGEADNQPLSPISDSILNEKPVMMMKPQLNGSARELINLLESQKEEIEDIKESLKDKDRIIRALRTGNRFKNTLAEYR